MADWVAEHSSHECPVIDAQDPTLSFNSLPSVKDGGLQAQSKWLAVILYGEEKMADWVAI